MSIPDEWNGFACVGAFEAMQFNGVVLPMDPTLCLIDSTIELWRKYGLQQQDQWLAMRYLCLLPFVDDPPRGIERVRQLVTELRMHNHEFREVDEALGHSQCDQALPLLCELGQDHTRLERFG